MAKAKKTTSKDTEAKKPAAAKTAKKADSLMKDKAATKASEAKKAAPLKATKATPAKQSEAKPKAAAPKAASAKKAATKSASAKPVTKTTGKKAGAAKAEPVAAPAAAMAAPARKSAADQKAPRAVSAGARELPLEYDDTKVVLMVRDPEWLFAYWEISGATRDELGIPRGRHSRPLVLRVFEFNGGTAPFQYDVPVNDYTSSWYVRLKDPAATAQVTLGLFDEEGEFVEITSSNRVQIPRMGISEKLDVEFAEVNDEIYDQIVQLSGGSQIGERLGSDEFLRSLQKRLYESVLDGMGASSGSFYGLSSGQFGGGSGMFSGSLIPSSVSFFSETMVSGAQKPTEAAGKRREFWLEVGVDVIVYGATEPDAKVNFMGRDIKLASDGTFRVRMVLPDTTLEFPVIAESSDGQETRKVKPVVERSTEGDPHHPA